MKYFFKEIESFFDEEHDSKLKLANQALDCRGVKKQNCELLEYSICHCISEFLSTLDEKYRETFKELKNYFDEDNSIAEFINKLLFELKNNKFKISNVAIHLMLQKPKLCRSDIGVNRKIDIRNYLKEIFRLEEERIVTHAGTGERIGNTGTYKSFISICNILISSLSEEERFIGFGFDRHRFKKDSVNNLKYLMICGQKINYNKSLDAHSDGDVVLHALVNAIFSTIGLGDIGEHFPDTDLMWKGSDSTRFLNYAIKRLKESNSKIIDVKVELVVSDKLFDCLDKNNCDFVMQSRVLISNFCDVEVKNIDFLIRLADGNLKNRDEFCIQDDLGLESRITIVVEPRQKLT